MSVHFYNSHDHTSPNTPVKNQKFVLEKSIIDKSKDGDQEKRSTSREGRVVEFPVDDKIQSGVLGSPLQDQTQSGVVGSPLQDQTQSGVDGSPLQDQTQSGVVGSPLQDQIQSGVMGPLFKTKLRVG